MDRLSEIEARWAKGKQGPWMWDVNKATHSAHLTTTHSGRIYIMGFRRWGTQRAQPIFQDYERGITEPLSKWAVPRMAHHPDFDMDIDHPDAQKIAAAPSDIAWLIQQVRGLREWQGRAVEVLEELGISSVGEITQNGKTYSIEGGNFIQCEYCGALWSTETPEEHEADCRLNNILQEARDNG